MKDKDSKDKLSDLRRRAELAAEKSSGVADVSALSREKVQELIHELQVHQIELEMQNEELRGTQQELETSRQKYFELYDVAPVGYFVLDQKGVILEANLTGCAILGTARGFLIGKPLAGFVNAEDGDALYLHLREVLETQSRQSCDIRLAKKDGSQAPVRLETVIVRGRDGPPSVFRTLVTDITRRKHAEEALFASENRYRRLFETARDGILIVDFDTGKILDVNQYLIDMLGYSHEEFLDKCLWEVSPLKDTPLNNAAFTALVEKGYVRYEDLPLETSDGRSINVEVVSNSYLVCGVTFIQCNIRDITDRKRAEHELRESEELHRLTISNISDSVLITDDMGDFTYVCPNTNLIFGYSQEEVEALRNVSKLLGHEFLEPFQHESRQEIHNIEGAIKDKFGKQHTLLVNVKRVDIKGGTVLYTCRDISNLKRAEESLREATGFLNTLLNAIPAPIFYKDTDGRYIGFNKSYGEFYGKTQQDFVGKSVFDIAPRDLAEVYHAKDLELFHNPGVQVYDSQVKDARGAVHDVVFHKSTFSDPQGHVLGLIGVILDITDRKRAEDAADRANQEWERTFNAFSDLVMVLDDQHKIVRANKAMADALGMTEQELIGKLCFELMHGEKEPPAFCPHCQLLTDGEDHSTEVAEPRLGGIFDVRVSPLVGQNGQIIGSVHITRDITERKRSEKALEEASAYNRNLIEASLDPLVTITAEGKINDVNGATERVTGYSRDELIGTDFADYFTDPQKAREGYQRAFKEGEIKDYELEIRHRDGDFTAVVYNASVYHDRSGKIVGLFAAARDISERKASEERIHIRLKLLEFAASHPLDELLQKTLDEIGALTNSPIGFYHFVESQKTLSLQAWSTRTAKEFCKAEGKGLHYRIDQAGVWVDCIRERKPVIHNDYSSLPHRKGMPEGHAAVTRELVVPIIKSGQIVAVLGIGNKPTDYTAKDIETVSYLADVAWEIARRKQGEEALRKSDEQYRTLFEDSIDGIYSVLRDGTITDANPSFCELFGYTTGEMIGKDIRELYLDATDRPRFQKEIEKSGFVKDYEIKFKKRDGTQVDCLLSSSVHFGKDRSIAGYRGIVRDLTARLQLHRQLQQAQKMEAVGTLAGGIAHDFNNILQVVLGYSELVLAEEDLPDRLRDDLEKVLLAGRNGADLVQRLLAFSRKAETEPLDIDLNQRIRQTQKFLQRTIPKMIDIELILAEDLGVIHADPTQVDQVLMNLAVNARDAMPEGGKLVIETAKVLLDEEYASSHLEAKPGWYTLLRVSDTGSGMDKETLEHIFEPFYTTKGPGEGTGLGLAMVFGIVKQHHGFINCYSEVGHGTTFKIYLPAVISEPQSDQPLVTAMPRGGTETILLVDDEELIRDLGKRILERSGYTVLTAANGKEALDLYKRERGKISLVILDLIMPEMGGKQCLEELLIIDPTARVLIASGFAANGQTKEAIETGATGFVGKPYNMKVMLQSVREVLDSQ